tara:strand:- start:1045 stop:1323 length:279 start_codon:yes stop_codon:yes gene_type:complete
VTNAAIAKANGTEKPTYPRYKVGGCMAIVKFCKRGFRPLPFATIKFASVGEKGFATKFVIIRKKNCMDTNTNITQGISSVYLFLFCKSTIKQ